MGTLSYETLHTRLGSRFSLARVTTRYMCFPVNSMKIFVLLSLHNRVLHLPIPNSPSAWYMYMHDCIHLLTEALFSRFLDRILAGIKVLKFNFMSVSKWDTVASLIQNSPFSCPPIHFSVHNNHSLCS